MKGGYSSSWVRPTTRLALYLRDGLGCVYCGQDWSVDGLVLDHVVSRSEGGSNRFYNVVSACPGCNTRKRNGGLVGLARYHGTTVRALKRRAEEAAVTNPSPRHRRRAIELRRDPPPWLRSLNAMNAHRAFEQRCGRDITADDQEVPF